MRVSATIFSISIFAVRSAANRSVWYGVFLFGHENDGITPNTTNNGTIPLVPVLPLTALILVGSMCLSSNYLCSALRTLKTLRTSL